MKLFMLKNLKVKYLISQKRDLGKIQRKYADFEVFWTLLMKMNKVLMISLSL